MRARTTKRPPRAARPAAEAASVDGVRITHPDRVLFASPARTKLDLARYYAAIADRLLPEIAGRPLSLVRRPDGLGGPAFFQKHAGPGFPAAVRRVPIDEAGGKALYLAVADREGLLALAQMNTVELHPWSARADDVEHADRLVFDLDPAPDIGWPAVVEAARACRSRLAALGLESFARTTGGKGLHVVVPIARRHDWDRVRGFARGFAEALAAAEPERYVARAAKRARRGRVFIDYMRNGRGATAVASYSPRARPGAPVATPLAWAELEAGVDPRRFTIETIPMRLARLEADPWRDMTKLRQRLPAMP